MKLAESTVLIVDDDEDIVIQATKILKNMGTTVLCAYDVVTALQVMQIQRPHLIVTDINMFPQNGFDLLSALKADKNLSGIPVVVLSSLNDKESVYKAISLGAKDYIIKPLKTVHLLKKVRRALRDADFLRYEFSFGERSDVDISLWGSVHSIGDIGIRIESNICFNRCTSLSVTSPRAENSEIAEVHFAIHKKGQVHLKGMYINELIAVALGPDFVKLRKALSR